MNKYNSACSSLRPGQLDRLTSKIKDKKPMLKRCPCGEIPESLEMEEGASCKYSFVSGSCCNEWSVEFRSRYINNDVVLLELATIAWNGAKRKQTL